MAGLANIPTDLRLCAHWVVVPSDCAEQEGFSKAAAWHSLAEVEAKIASMAGAYAGFVLTATD